MRPSDLGDSVGGVLTSNDFSSWYPNSSVPKVRLITHLLLLILTDFFGPEETFSCHLQDCTEGGIGYGVSRYLTSLWYARTWIDPVLTHSR